MLENVAGFIQKAQACLGAGFAPHRREVYYDVLAAQHVHGEAREILVLSAKSLPSCGASRSS